jgi:hypothetical protein
MKIHDILIILYILVEVIEKIKYMDVVWGDTENS